MDPKTRTIKIEGKEDKEQEVTVRHEGVPKKKGSSVWSGREEFTREWSETFTTKKRKKIEKKENDKGRRIHYDYARTQVGNGKYLCGRSC